MKGISILVLGSAIGYLAYPQVQSFRKPKVSDDALVALAPASDAVIAQAASPTPRYVNPLDRAAYNQQHVTSGAVVYYTGSTAPATSTTVVVTQPAQTPVPATVLRTGNR